MKKQTVAVSTFESLDIRVGTVVSASPFEGARKPALKLWIDFGELGVLKSSAQLTVHYTAEMLIDKQVIAVVNFAPRQIADFMSECLVLGIYDTHGGVVLIQPHNKVDNGCMLG